MTYELKDYLKSKNKTKEKRGKYITNAMQITMRIEMTNQSILRWIHGTLKVGTVRKRNRSPSVKAHWKDRWTYTVRFRQAYYLSCLIWPYAHVKLDKIQKIIDHYDGKIFDGKVNELLSRVDDRKELDTLSSVVGITNILDRNLNDLFKIHFRF